MRRAFNSEKYEFLMGEMENLISSEFIRKAIDLKCISNPFLVDKHDGKWRVSIDFSNLNQACTMDNIPFLMIDQLMDSTVEAWIIERYECLFKVWLDFYAPFRRGKHIFHYR